MRLPFIPPSQLTVEQRALYDDMASGIKSGYQGFRSIREDGALMGPWNPWLHQPKIGAAVWSLLKSISRQSTMPDSCRQIAILVTGAHFRAGYEIYAHAAVAQMDGLSNDTVATIVAGQRPSDLPKDQAIAYDTAAALVRGGPMPELNYRQAKDVFGENGVAELIYLVGAYSMVSLTLNGFDVPIPGTERN